MKTLLLRWGIAGFAMILFATANAQVTIKNNGSSASQSSNRNNGTGVLKSSTISGTIRYAKSIGPINDFITTVKARTVVNSYQLINGQLSDKKTIAISGMKVINATRTDSPDFVYSYEITAVFPFNRPIDVVIDYGEYKFTWVLSLSKTDAGEYATITDRDLTYSGFDFKGIAVPHPH